MTKTKTKPVTAISGDSWFTVDKVGLSQLLTRKHGKLHAIVELVSNAWDQVATVVNVSLTEYIAGRYLLVVEDDDPEGFADLTHAYTVFAPSTKKGDVLKRGRFNLGEKLVLALCDEASITTTKGTVRFTPEGTREVTGTIRKVGSEFRGIIAMTEKEAVEAVLGLQALIPPTGIQTFINSQGVNEREPALIFTGHLDTEVAGEDGNLKRTARIGEMRLYLPHTDERPTIYEMGIPVVGSTGYYHVNVMQKVPLNMDRDNVTPGYAKSLHVHIMNAAYSILPADQFTTAWARSALGDSRITTEAVEASVKARFGDKVVAFDPSDPEANRLAVAQGYSLVHGGSLSGQEWDRVKDSGAIRPAGQVTPSPKVEFAAAGGESAYILEADWTPGMRAMATHTETFASFAKLSVQVRFINEMTTGFLARCGPAGILIYNVGRLGKRWFEEIGVRQDALMLHELGHVRCAGENAGHLSAEYPDEIARLGAQYGAYRGRTTP